MNSKAQIGLWNAPSEKRYKSFLNTIADKSFIWLINSNDGYKVFEMNGRFNIMVWPEAVFCEPFLEDGEYIERMEVHTFIKEIKKLGAEYGFMVFSTDKNAYMVSINQLYEDIQKHLDEVE